MDRVALNPHPFRYPVQPHERRHGPIGYPKYKRYQPWLEDDFSFRCIYCLKRQKWAPTDIWAVDHLIPQADDPERACDYTNLVLACQWCNGIKSASELPDPTKVGYGACLHLNDQSAEVEALNEAGQVLLRVLKLNSRQQVAYRKERLSTLRIMARCAPNEWRELMGYPNALPDLRKKKPPGGNTKPGGIAECFYEQKMRGKLFEIYES